ncbi:hypothetical protein ACFL1M_02530 [Patescibacteria group bacterium]
MKKKNTYLLVIFLLLIVTMLVLLSRRSKQLETETPQETEKNSIRATPLPNTSQENPIISTRLKSPPINKEMPQYKIEWGSISKQMELLKTFFNIQAEPKKTNFDNRSGFISSDVNGEIYIENSPRYFYFNNNDSSNYQGPGLEKLEAEGKAKDLVKQFGVLPNKIEHKIIKTQYLDLTGGEVRFVSKRESATHTRVSIVYYINNFPLILSTQIQYSLSITLNSNGSIKSMSGYFIDNIAEDKNLSILNTNEASIKLTSNQGQLIRADVIDSNYGLSEINFNKASINQSSLGYTLNESNGLLSPIYIFEGTAPQNVKPFSTYSITYIVSAIK